ncbi:cytochrome c551/c552 [Oxalobacteraceae bacterium GrIS 1.11]
MKYSTLLAALLCAGRAAALDFAPPPESAMYQSSALPGYQLALRHCMTCHSAQYVLTQPPSSPRAYWEATVKKMRKPFGAQFPEQDIGPLTDYLVKTYGAERGAPLVTAAVIPNAVPAAPANAQALLAANACLSCHAPDKKIVGPAFKEIAARYTGKADGIMLAARNIRAGGAGKWGPVPMPPYAQLSEADSLELARFVLRQ